MENSSVIEGVLQITVVVNLYPEIASLENQIRTGVGETKKFVSIVEKHIQITIITRTGDFVAGIVMGCGDMKAEPYL